MHAFFRWSLIILVVLLAPVIPFLAFGPAADAWVEDRLSDQVSPESAAAFVVGVLATDVFLPVPSSAVSTFSGQRLGVPLGALASWIGMSVGATIAFAVARRWGKPLAARLAGDVEYARMERLSTERGAQLIVITRALPVLAEASVLVLGATQLTWRRFLPAMLLSNLGLSLAYAIFGAYSRAADAQIAALLASITLPLLAAGVAKVLWPTSSAVTEGEQSR